MPELGDGLTLPGRFRTKSGSVHVLWALFSFTGHFCIRSGEVLPFMPFFGFFDQIQGSFSF